MGITTDGLADVAGSDAGNVAGAALRRRTGAAFTTTFGNLAFSACDLRAAAAITRSDSTSTFADLMASRSRERDFRKPATWGAGMTTFGTLALAAGFLVGVFARGATTLLVRLRAAFAGFVGAGDLAVPLARVTRALDLDFTFAELLRAETARSDFGRAARVLEGLDSVSSGWARPEARAGRAFVPELPTERLDVRMAPRTGFFSGFIG